MINESKISINQNVAILIDGNNIERSIHAESNDTSSMLNIDELVPELLKDRQLNRMVYFREGKNISTKLSERFQKNYHGSVIPCHKSADIPLTIKATQLASKVDTIIIMSGDSDFVELVTHLQAMGVRVEIAAVKSTTSKYLLEVADQFHAITKEHWFIFGKKRPVHNKSKADTNPKATTSTRTTQSDEQRLEQSLRDKERNKKIREEKLKLDSDLQVKQTTEKSTLVEEVISKPEEEINGNLIEPKTVKKKVAKKATKKVAKKVAKKAVKKVAKKVVKKVAKKVAKKVTKKIAKKTN